MSGSEINVVITLRSKATYSIAFAVLRLLPSLLLDILHEQSLEQRLALSLDAHW